MNGSVLEFKDGSKRLNRRVTLVARAMVLGAVAVSVQHTSDASAHTLISVFTNPVLSGYETDASGALTFNDNTSTAVFSGTGTNTINFGTNPVGSAQRYGTHDTLTFNGFSNLPLDSSGSIPIGTLSFTNGTVAAGTDIFGVTLSFYLDSVGSGSLLGSDSIIFSTKYNQYGGTGMLVTDPAKLQNDADYINICGNSSTVCSTSIESYELAEVGASYVPVTVDLLAAYQFDPSITITGVILDPTNPGSGYLGRDAAITAVPEPGSLALLAGGAFGLLGFKRRKL